MMDNEKFMDQNSDRAKVFNLKIPYRLAERVETYVDTNNTTFTGVVIEALDTFLRKQQNRSNR